MNLMKSSRKPIRPQDSVTKMTVSPVSLYFEKTKNASDAASRIRIPPAVGVPRFATWRCGPFLADLLAELLAAEERDEARPGEDRDDAGDDAGDEDSAHAVTPASASATRSRPSARAPLTSTQSPGSSSARTSVSASSASAA